MHIFAHGLGAPAALRLARSLTREEANLTIASLVLSSPFGTIDDLSAAAARRLVDFAELYPQEEKPAPTTAKGMRGHERFAARSRASGTLINEHDD